MRGGRGGVGWGGVRWGGLGRNGAGWGGLGRVGGGGGGFEYIFCGFVVLRLWAPPAFCASLVIACCVFVWTVMCLFFSSTHENWPHQTLRIRFFLCAPSSKLKMPSKFTSTHDFIHPDPAESAKNLKSKYD